MAKNRRKKRRKRQGGQAAVPPLPRPSRARNQGAALRPDAVAARVAAEPSMPHKVGDVVSATVTDFRDDGGLSLDVDGLVGIVPLGELNLADSESAQDRYAIGETIEDLFVWGSDHEFRLLALSTKRNAPGYVDALQRHTVGDVVEATVTDFQDNGGITLDVDGLVGGVPPWELSLAGGESAQERYTIGERIDGLFVWQVNSDEVDRDARVLFLSAKRDGPGYVEALQWRTVGDIVSATIIGFQSNGGLWLDVNGLVGGIPPREITLADGDSAQEHYAIGETIEDLLVWQVHHETRHLDLSAKRNEPGYVEALQRRTVGDIVSATIIGFQSNGGLWLDVNGLVGGIPPWEITLADRDSAQEHYAIGETIEGLFVWVVDHNAQHLLLSAKCNAPGYVEALDAIDRGDKIDGLVIEASKWGVWLDAAGVTGWIPASELALDEEESPQARYATGDGITARVWQIDHEARGIILSVRRLAADFVEESVVLGEPIDAAVRGTTSRDIPMPIRVMAANHEVWVPVHELALTIGVPTQFKNEDTIRPIVVEVDGDGGPTRLSLRRALGGWDAAVEQLSASNFLVPNARIVPHGAVTAAELRNGSVAVDLGPILGLISQGELSQEAGRVLMEQSSNHEHGVVVDSVDREHGFAYVSHERFQARWREVAEQLELEQGAEIEGELRDFSGSKQEVALLDLGSGLLAQMPARKLPKSDPPGKAAIDRIGERFLLRITTIERDQQTVHAEPRDHWLESLIGATESETLEFKAVLRGSGDKNKRDQNEHGKERPKEKQRERRNMTHEAMRTITGFLNTSGGNLVIGVDDEREVVGLEGDNGLAGKTMAKRIDSAIKTLEDNMRNVWPLNVFDDRVDLRDLVTWTTPQVRGQTLLVVRCQRGPDGGVWLVGKRQPQFWIRQGQETVRLHGRDAIRAHLGDRRQRRATSDEANSDE